MHSMAQIDIGLSRPFWITSKRSSRANNPLPKYLKLDLQTIFGDAIICAITFLLVNDLFKTNYSKRLRWPPIDLRRGVHLKHQNLISKFENFWEKNMSGSRWFYSVFTGLMFDGNASGVCEKDWFWKMLHNSLVNMSNGLLELEL